MGLATANISNGVNGEVISFGTLTGVDTRGDVTSALAVGDETWAAGDILYAHPTVDGKLTKVRPQHDLAVAFITVRHQSSGQLAVRIVPGNFHLEWLHDVELDNPTEGQVLQYDGTDWVNAGIEIPPGTQVSETAPSSPEEGQMWWNSATGVLYIYYDNFWVEAVAGVVGPAGADGADGESAVLEPVEVSSNITLVAKNRYFVNTSSARTLTLPASPAVGDEIQVFDATGTAGTNVITIANNSLKINGVNDSALLDANGVAASFVYTGSTYGWRMG
jgi:hypothetical protein